LIDLGRLARNLEQEAGRPLPWTAPFASTAPLEALKAPREEALAVADGIGRIENRLARALTYRSVLSTAFVLPRLPVAASGEDLAALEISLANTVSATRDALDSLPRDPALKANRKLAGETLAFMESWQRRYLVALREDRPQRAAQLVNRLTTEVEKVRRGVIDPLQRIGAWVERRINLLTGELEALADQLE
jgi:hypothetical protein